jgi:alcohol dehydrogenase class IV
VSVPASALETFGLLRPPGTILLGEGAASEVGRLAMPYGERILVVTDTHIAATEHRTRLVAALESAGARTTVLPAAVAELPLPAVETAAAEARRVNPDCIVGLGGGSCIDLAKLIALSLTVGSPLSRWYGESAVPGSVLPVIAVPTTAGTGSEITPVAVLTDPARTLKVGISSAYLVPRAAICDPLLTHGAPPTVTAYAGIDALAHAVEAYCAVRLDSWREVRERVFVGRNMFSDMFALRAVELIGGSLRKALDDDPHARSAMAVGSLCAGLAFATAGTALAHALQYPIGARTGTPHGLGVGLLLPFAMAFNATAVPRRIEAVARALGSGGSVSDAVTAVQQLASDIGIPGSLRELDISEGELPGIAEQALGIRRLIQNNPRHVGTEEATAVLTEAHKGTALALLDGDHPR